MSPELPDSRETARAVDDGAAGRAQRPRIGVAGRSRPTIIELNSPHAPKFRLVTGFLLGIAVAALGLAVALASNGTTITSNRPWSAWKPTTGGKLGATEIAEHVAPFYRLTSAAQLDVVTVVNLANPNAQGTGTASGLTVAVNTAAPGSVPALALLGGSSIAYNMCGTGGQSDCQVAGTASGARALLLRREALELALYSFKYLSGVSNVICILPPGHVQGYSKLSSRLPSAKAVTSPPLVTEAVLFQRQELQPWLSTPLTSTLQPYPPPVAELPVWQNTEEAGLVDQITARGLYSEQVESEQAGGNLLVLNQLPPE